MLHRAPLAALDIVHPFRRLHFVTSRAPPIGPKAPPSRTSDCTRDVAWPSRIRVEARELLVHWLRAVADPARRILRYAYCSDFNLDHDFTGTTTNQGATLH